MYAALIRASQTWRRVVISEFEVKQIGELRNELDNEFKERTIVSKVQRASHERIYSKHGT
jgi:ribosome-binding factor A